jgi:hypothetical protein
MTEDHKKHPSRRSFLAASAGAAALPAALDLSGQTPAAVGGEDITLALVNGKIHTMDAANTVATSVTIRLRSSIYEAIPLSQGWWNRTFIS